MIFCITVECKDGGQTAVTKGCFHAGPGLRSWQSFIQKIETLRKGGGGEGKEGGTQHTSDQSTFVYKALK